MTLVLTEVSSDGIAMLADSMISRVGLITGRIGVGPPEFRQKLFKVPKIKAGTAYWGDIGCIRSNFGEWFEAQIHLCQYSDLREFAQCIADSLNAEFARKAMPSTMTAGVHIAGYYPWSHDGVKRPTFFHVHNGHLNLEMKYDGPDTPIVMTCGTGEALPYASANDERESSLRELLEAGKHASISWERKMQPRTHFQVHMDFPRPNLSKEDSLKELERGYLTQNGDFGHFILTSQPWFISRRTVGSSADVFSQSMENPIGSEIAQLELLMTKVIERMRNDGSAMTIGGKIWGLGINADGKYTSCDKQL